MIWAETALNALRELARLGLSSRRIAAQLGVSKDSVRGQLYRQQMAEAPPYRPPPPAPLPKWPSVHECRFILDDGPWKGKSPLWCAKPVRPGSPYCEEHYIRCYQRGPR